MYNAVRTGKCRVGQISRFQVENSLNRFLKYAGIFLFMIASANLFPGCEKETSTPPLHYTVCVTCVRLGSVDTLPDKCMQDDLVNNYIYKMENARFVVSGNPNPHKCWIHKQKY